MNRDYGERSNEVFVTRSAQARKEPRRLRLPIVLGALALAACGQPVRSDQTDQMTGAFAEPLAQATATMLPTPTATLSPSPSSELPTAEAIETAQAADREAVELQAFGLQTANGVIRLRMTVDPVTKVLGDPIEKTTTPAVGSAEWRYANGVVIRFNGTSDEPGSVWGIVARSPFDGSTVDGVRLGDDEAMIRSLYDQFAIETFENPRQLQIEGRPADRTGLLMHVLFDADGTAELISFDDNTFNQAQR